MEEWEDGEGCVDIDECSPQYQATLTDNGYGKHCAYISSILIQGVLFFPHKLKILDV